MLLKLRFANGNRLALIPLCLILLSQPFLALPASSRPDGFPTAVVLGRYDLFRDTFWIVYNVTVGDLKNQGWDVSGDLNHVVQANYTYLNYSLKSKVVGVFWPDAAVQVTQGTYDLNMTAFKVLDNGAIGDRVWSFIRSNVSAVLHPPSNFTDPNLGVAFDPSEFTVGNTFVTSTRTYTVNRTETVSGTPWGRNDTYVAVAQFTNATHSYSWASWCDATSASF